jgi:hypothetical protein
LALALSKVYAIRRIIAKPFAQSSPLLH